MKKLLLKKLRTIWCFLVIVIFHFCSEPIMAIPKKQSKVPLKINCRAQTALIGDTINISWNTEAINSVIVASNSQEIPNTGLLQIRIVKDTTINLYFKASEKIIKKSFPVYVLKPKIRSFLVSSLNTSDMNPIILKWETSNVAKVKLSVSDSLFAPNGKFEYQPTNTQKIIIKAIDRNGFFDTTSVFVKVKNIDIFKRPLSCYLGTTECYSWHYKNALYVMVNDKKFKAKDSLMFVVQPKNIFNFYVQWADEKFLQFSDTLKGLKRKKDVLELNNKKYAGESCFVEWDFTGAAYVTINDGAEKLPAKSSKQYYPEKTTEYKIQAFDRFDNKIDEYIYTQYIISGFSAAEMQSVSYKRAASVPDSIALNVEKLSKFLIKGFTNDCDKVYSIIYWIALNIGFDENYLRFKIIPESGSQITLKRKSAVCEGFSNLFNDLCQYSGVKSKLIRGYAKQYLMPIIINTDKLPHGWNAVMINKKWYLLDITWASCKTDKWDF